MTDRAPLHRKAWLIAIAIGLFFPALSLLPLGSLWLWQQGYLLYWALVSVTVVATVYVLLRRLLRSVNTQKPLQNESAEDSEAGLSEPGWTPAENMAWADVLAIAREVELQRLNSQEAVIALGVATIQAVAKRLHPEVSEPVWQFTVPEALVIVEQVSRRLGTFAAENIPLSDRLTVAQVLSLYRWRGAVAVAEKAYDVWRLVRMVNPLTAATHELRERLSKQVMQWGRDHVTRRLAHAYVTEIGRAAIDLYGGRLKISGHQGSARREDTVQNAELDTTEPLRILIAGQTGAGKSSLVNALASEVSAAVDSLPTTSDYMTYALRTSKYPAAEIVDSPGLMIGRNDHARLVEHALSCDLLLWIAPAHRADRDVDSTALIAIRMAFAARPNRRPPPMLLIISNIDKLRPFGEWRPPYDLVVSDRLKARSIRDAITQVGRELDFDDADIVPVHLATTPAYNIDAVWARMLHALPDAQSARLVRHIRHASSNWDWRRTLAQATAAGRVIRRTLTSKS